MIGSFIASRNDARGRSLDWSPLRLSRASAPRLQSAPRDANARDGPGHDGGWFPTPLALFVEAFPHFLAGFEKRHEFLIHGHLVAGARVAPGAGLALFGGKGAEAAQFDAVAARHRPRDLVEDRVDDVLDVTLVQVRVARRQTLNQFRFDHDAAPLATAPPRGCP